MLADRRSESMVTNFAAQWLYLRDIEAKLPDEILFPDFDETLRTAFRRETELFIDSILRDNAACWICSRATTRSSMSGWPSTTESRTSGQPLPPSLPAPRQRARRSARPRQHSCRHVVLHENLSGPAREVGARKSALLGPAAPAARRPVARSPRAGARKPLTLREAMVGIAPTPPAPGVTRAWIRSASPWRISTRSASGGSGRRQRPIDASASFPTVRRSRDIDGLKQELLRQSEQFVPTVTEKLLMYAIGRNLQYYDAPAVRADRPRMRRRHVHAVVSGAGRREESIRSR